MKLNNIMITVLWISLLAIPPSTQAGNDEVLRGFMSIMQEMQKQSGADADPNSKAIMDAFGKAMGGKGDRDRQGKGKGDRDRQGKGKGKGDRDRQGKGKGDRDRQGKGKKRQAKGDRQRRQN
ncbi:MAG: hypothetical protein KDJ28_04035 [Candidatus Competibacteraceae bacterium]|nr:hypothetical protein [Candidatus Competibacteraceae bacterium]